MIAFDAVKSLQGMMDERRLDQWTIREVNGVKIDLWYKHIAVNR